MTRTFAAPHMAAIPGNPNNPVGLEIERKATRAKQRRDEQSRKHAAEAEKRAEAWGLDTSDPRIVPDKD